MYMERHTHMHIYLLWIYVCLRQKEMYKFWFRHFEIPLPRWGSPPPHQRFRVVINVLHPSVHDGKVASP